MNALDFLEQYGYLIFFGFLLLERIGVPLPAIPALVGAGALARDGRLDVGAVLIVALGASLLADLTWYWIGRVRGAEVMRVLCKISLEPDSCVRRTETMFASYGTGSLLFAKFIGPLNAVAVPLAGVRRTPIMRFLLLDGIGSLVWILGFVGLGWVFHEQLELLLTKLTVVGTGMVGVLSGGLLLYVAWKWFCRRRFLRRLAGARITPDALRAMLAAGEKPFIVDLRHAADRDADPATIPGAISIPVEEFERRHVELPRDRELILVCT